ncbi:MAG: type II toxin-antitoxin system HicB family antitoxin [Synergistaceae bacterium]|nr:type II toxin-antitoxin system HicB family antitoxin [Synergistaceae bacterium]MBQ9629029.1 type II toxin-antitoxin system HicB family antitoxin [Synergistaceae bacterium]MBR0251565.1 type II toxin-antitoxin system HicB family antitoxin [Synergistaceae bacterium]
MKSYYTYPAVLDYAPDGISIFFPDFPGCMSCADNDDEAAYMAQDALEGWLLIAEDRHQNIPEPTPLSEVCKTLKPNQASTLVRVNMKKLRATQEDKAMNKMVTLPRWLIDEGKEAGINFSHTLQDALVDKLGIKREIRRRKVSS